MELYMWTLPISISFSFIFGNASFFLIHLCSFNFGFFLKNIHIFSFSFCGSSFDFYLSF
jgi:hypothetical protein